MSMCGDAFAPAPGGFDGFVLGLAQGFGVSPALAAGVMIAGLACGLAFAVHGLTLFIAGLLERRALEQGATGKGEAEPPARGI